MNNNLTFRAWLGNLRQFLDSHRDFRIFFRGSHNFGDGRDNDINMNNDIYMNNDILPTVHRVRKQQHMM